MSTKHSSKISLNLTDAEKNTFENFVRGRSRSDLTETCLGHLGPSLIHPRSWFLLTILFDLRSLQENRDTSLKSWLKTLSNEYIYAEQNPNRTRDICFEEIGGCKGFLLWFFLSWSIDYRTKSAKAKFKKITSWDFYHPISHCASERYVVSFGHISGKYVAVPNFWRLLMIKMALIMLFQLVNTLPNCSWIEWIFFKINSLQFLDFRNLFFGSSLEFKKILK